MNDSVSSLNAPEPASSLADDRRASPRLVEETEKVIALDAQPILRNLMITESYHHLSERIAGMVGKENVNWCTFATWASKTAGHFIRYEDVCLFYRAKFETDPERKAELILLANSLTGLHEQIRLQPYIVGAIEAPVADPLEALHQELIGRRPRTWFWRLCALPVRFLWNRFVASVEQDWRDVSTHFLMTLTLPDGTLHLGTDLPAPPGEPLFPPALQFIGMEALGQLLTQYGADGSTDRSSGAQDWTVLSQRMKYILDLFRSRQQDAHLFEQPFTDQQRASIAHGQVPAGPL